MNPSKIRIYQRSGMWITQFPWGLVWTCKTWKEALQVADGVRAFER